MFPNNFFRFPFFKFRTKKSVSVICMHFQSTAFELKSPHVTTISVESSSSTCGGGGHNGTTASANNDNQKKIMVSFAHIHLPDVFAVEFQLERSDLIKLDMYACDD